MNYIELVPVRIMDTLKRVFHVRTHHVEQAVVALALISVALITGKGWVEWVGALAVFFTFCHANVADRLAEYEAKRVSERGIAEVWC